MRRLVRSIGVIILISYCIACCGYLFTILHSNFLSICQIFFEIPGSDHISNCGVLGSVLVIIMNLSDCGSSFLGTGAPSNRELETWVQDSAPRRDGTEQNIV